jgi:phosphomethylpyrimidine synthase
MSSISRRKRRNQAAQFLKNVADQSFPNSNKVYVPGKIHDIRVGMREITLSDTLINGNKDQPSYEKNPPLCVYDTSGFYTDNSVVIDVHKGIPRVRDSWIDSRDDVEFLQEKTSIYSQQRVTDEGLDHIRFEHLPKVRKCIMPAKALLRLKWNMLPFVRI